jgi:hypothetical protein
VESEDIATYSWMWSCLFLMSDDNMSREDVRVVAADQMIKQKNLTEDFNLPNAELIMDRWHLKNKNFQENFKGHHEVIKGSLNELLLAESESEFNDTCKKIEQKLISLGASNQELAYLDTISKKRRHLATYELNSMRCSFGLLGSTASENNHSSIHRHCEESYHQHPIVFQADLMDREYHFKKRFNDILSKKPAIQK